MVKLPRAIRSQIPNITPFLVSAGLWWVSGLVDTSIASRLLLLGSLPIMLWLTHMSQVIHDTKEKNTTRARLLLPMFVVSAFACSLFLETPTHRLFLAAFVLVILFSGIKQGASSRSDVVPAIAMATLFFAAYSLFGVGSFLEVPRVALVIGAGAVAGISAHDVFARMHPDRATRRLLVFSFAVVAMEFFVAISLLPTNALVNAALLSVPLASSFIVARTLIHSETTHSFSRELVLCLVCMGLVISTARWV